MLSAVALPPWYPPFAAAAPSSASPEHVQDCAAGTGPGIPAQEAVCLPQHSERAAALANFASRAADRGVLCVPRAWQQDCRVAGDMSLAHHVARAQSEASPGLPARARSRKELGLGCPRFPTRHYYHLPRIDFNSCKGEVKAT